jgi:hypothetical protein
VTEENATVRATALPGSTGDVLRSALYEGRLFHRHDGPGPRHEFTYRVAMPLLDLAEITRVTQLHPLWSSRRAAPVRFRRQDFLGDPSVDVADAVRDLVEERSGTRPLGPISLLANLRTWGWLFNPLSVYFCHDASGSLVQALVLEVENTPWHERTSYVVGAPGEHRFAKNFHVSPFLPMDVDYVLRYTAPAEGLTVEMEVRRGDELLFEASLSLRRRALDRRALGRLLWAHPALTHRISAGIYAQAARLRLRGAPFHAHPSHTGDPGSPSMDNRDAEASWTGILRRTQGARQ